MENNLTCYIVDDQKDSIERLEYLLHKCEGITIVGKNTNPGIAINEIIKAAPIIVFIDVEMPQMTGFETIQQIRSQNFYPKFIFTTGYSQYAIKAIKAEAYDYLLKPIDLDELKTTLNRTKPLNGYSKTFQNLKLSTREHDVLELVLKGKTSQQIADELFISKNTVDTHRRNILEKNNFKSTNELLIAVNNGY